MLRTFLRSRAPGRDQVAALPRANLAGLAHAPATEGEDWVNTDVVQDNGGVWTAHFSDQEVQNAARTIGLIGHTAQSEGSEDDVESIDGDAQMQSLHVRQPGFTSMSDMAINLATRPAVQAAMMNEIRSDPVLMDQMKACLESYGLEGVQIRLLDIPSQQQQRLGVKAIDFGADEGSGPHPLERLVAGIVAATKHTGAAIGKFVQGVVARIVDLSRALRGQRGVKGNGLEFDDEASIQVERSRVLMDMGFAVATLLVVVMMLTRGGVRLS